MMRKKFVLGDNNYDPKQNVPLINVEVKINKV